MLVQILVVLMQSQAPPRDVRATAAAGTAIISGVITSDDADARPLRRTRVTVNGSPLDMGRTTITSDDGGFTFAGLPPGSYALSAWKDAYVPMNYGATRTGRLGRPVIVAAGQTERISFRLPRGAVITGAVVDTDGQPVQGIAVTALERRFTGATGEFRYAPAGAQALPTDDRGVYRIYGLPAGEYVVAAQPQTQGVSQQIRAMGRDDRAFALTQVFHPSAVDLARATRIAVRAGEERSGIDVQLQYTAVATLSGTVAVPPGWNPAEVALGRAGEMAGQVGIRSTRADASGRFSLADLPSGEYRLLARSAGTKGGGLLASAVDVTLDGEDVDNFVVQLQPALTISGLIVFRGDTPPPVFGTMTSAPVPLSLALGSGRATVMPMLKIDGVHFGFEGIVPGPYRVGGNIQGLRSPIGGWWLQSVTAGGVELLDAPLDVHQSIEGAVATFTDRVSEIAGTVKDAQGHPVSGVWVVAFSPDRSAWFFESRRVGAATTSVDGRYSIRNLPPGEYRVVVSTELEPREWFDPAVLERLLPGGTPTTIAGSEKNTVNLAVR